MAKIEGDCRDVCEATEFVTIVITGDDGPHVVGNWGDYMRALGIGADTIVLPAGRYRQTAQNLRKNDRKQLLVASRKVQGVRSPGTGLRNEGACRATTASGKSDERRKDETRRT